jgi:hypothetical protein
MKKKNLLLLGLLAVFTMSCGGAEETEESSEEEVVEEACTYSYDESSTVFTWTAFKLTEKIGVDGTFDDITVNANNESEDMFAVLAGATFEIAVGSVNSQDDVRDPKIKNSFFGNMTDTEMITGTVNSINETTASVTVNMNGVSADYEGEVKVEDMTITMLTTIDILDFEAQTSLDSLGVVCAEKHTGEDGVNKFWSDVNIAVKTTLVKNCE